ncbi:conserved hypothetical protein [delta proteobacterium NaphS2]|nr:conserved hypothetical protein [delta proteobacterium NaphS2]
MMVGEVKTKPEKSFAYAPLFMRRAVDDEFLLIGGRGF